MVDIIGTTVGEIVTAVCYNGTYFQVPPCIESPPLGKDRSRAELWDTIVALGATLNILAETAGSGYVTDVMFRAKGAANTARRSEVQVTLDDAQVAEFKLEEMLFLNNGALFGFADIECFVWDDVGDEYFVHWKVEIPFKSSIKIDVFNGDLANATTMRVMVVYRLDLP